MCESSSTSEIHEFDKDALSSRSQKPVVVPIPNENLVLTTGEIPLVAEGHMDTTLSFEDLIENNARIWNIYKDVELPSRLNSILQDIMIDMDGLSEYNSEGSRALNSVLDAILADLHEPYNEDSLILYSYGLNIYGKVSSLVSYLYNNLTDQPLKKSISDVMNKFNNIIGKRTTLQTWVNRKYSEKETALGSDLVDGKIAFYDNKVQMLDLTNILLIYSEIISNEITIKPNPGSYKKLSKHNRKLVAEGILAADRFIDMSESYKDGSFPEVSFDTSHPIKRPGAMMNHYGVMSIGIAAIPTQISHELGHHIENHLNLEDFLTLHNFLRGRTNPEGGGSKLVGHPIHKMLSGTGYDAVLPKLTFMSKFDHFLFCNTSFKAMLFKNIMNMPGKLGKIIRTIIDTVGYAGLGSAIFALIGTFVPGLGTITGAVVGAILGSIVGLVKGLFHSEKKKEENVRNYFYEVSNSQEGSYATMFRQGASPDNDSGSTEFLSTTFELMANKVGRDELANKDPLRVVLFFYLVNRPLYRKIKDAFEEKHTDCQLDEMIHVVKL